MSLSMPAPYKHPKTGTYWVRKVVPKPLRAAVGKGELKASLRTKDPAEAKTRCRAEYDRLDAIIESAKARMTGTQRPLTAREVTAIVGAAYRARLEAFKDDPGPAHRWDEELDYLITLSEPDQDGTNGGRRLFFPDRFILEEANGLLTSQGIVGDRQMVQEVAEAWSRERARLASLMLRRIEGDWSAGTGLERFPSVAKETDQPPVLMTDLLQGWAAETNKTGKALYDRERTVAAFAKHLGHGDASRVTADDVVAFKEARLATGVSNKTVANDLNELSPLWRWAKRNRRLAFIENPFAGVAPLKQAGADPTRHRYELDEAKRLLEAARREQSSLLRWLPWLQCFTAGRLGEVCQSHKEDLPPINGVQGGWALHIHKNGPGRSLKTPQSQRKVPLHPALIAEGFLDYLAGLPPGSPLFPDVGLDKFGSRKGRAGNIHSRWVREVVGIKDTLKDPAHAWRHLFEDRGRGAGLPQPVIDAFMGHKNAQNKAEGYGRGYRFMPETTAAHMGLMFNPAA